MPSWHIDRLRYEMCKAESQDLGLFFGIFVSRCHYTSHCAFACVVVHGRLQKPLADPSVGFVGSVLSSVELTLHSESGS